ncbi:uncharacterized protein TNCV_3972391 [Trichonephila clavipes]|nr:uncharacterized protein TNCV_3972391 [Trichonephila clavipes]
MNLASNCVLTITEEKSGDTQSCVPILLSLLHAAQALDQELWSEIPFLLTAGPLWSSLEIHLRRRHSENCLATIPFAIPWPYFSEDKTSPHAAPVSMNCLTACQIFPLPA